LGTIKNQKKPTGVKGRNKMGLTKKNKGKERATRHTMPQGDVGTNPKKETLKSQN